MNVKMIVFCILMLMTCLMFSADKQQGELTVLTGPMYSEKTKHLIEFIKKSREEGLNVQVYSHCLDARSDNKLCSRALPNEDIKAFKTSDTSDIVKDYMRGDFSCVAIDEVQFFDIQLCKYISMMLDCRAQVCVAGLDMNFKGEPFGQTMGMLCQIANKVVKLKAICAVCRENNATLTQRLVNGRPASRDDNELVIDGSKKEIKYEPRCRNCHKVN